MLKNVLVNLIPNIVNFSNSRIQLHGAQYCAFGIFIILSYFIPFFLWTPYINQEYYLVISILRVIIAISSFLLMVEQYWPINLDRYKAIYWHFCVMIALPFYSFVNLFLAKDNLLSFINIVTSLLFTMLLVDWLSFIFIYGIGSISAVIFYQILVTRYPVKPSWIEYVSTNTYEVIYLVIFCTIVGAVFSRNKDFIQKKILQAKEQLNCQLETKIQERTKDLSEALSIKKYFLNNMSHEIRTPLQGIVGISHGLQDNWNELPETQRKNLLDKIVSNNNRLMNLVSNLLDMSKFESGKMSFIMQKGDIIKTIKSVIAEFDNSLNKFKIFFKNKAPTKTIIIKYDEGRISQVIRNLLSNSVKYGKNSDIEVIVNNNAVNFLEITVIDGGIGISDEELELILNPFTESSRTKTMAGGTGLGLSICKEIILAHNGNIKAVNKNDKTSISFTLPI